MALLSLNTENFRNLQSRRLEFSENFNFVVGANGSGKTSLLEAICYLSSGRSFRTHKHEVVVRHGADHLTVFGIVRDKAETGGLPGGEGWADHRVGISRDLKARETVLKLDGERVRSMAALARLLPVLVIEPGSFEIVAGGPGRRRQYLDWITFHVEHGFGGQWQALQRAITQRNQLLRSGRINDSVMRVWNERYAALSEELSESRRRCFALLRPLIESAVGGMQGPWAKQVQVEFFQGWDSSRELLEVLEEHVDQERKVGHTLYGPNRADIRIRVGGRPAQDVLSRGQQKSLVILLKLAQVELLHDTDGRRCTFLIDDINAELDQPHRERLLYRLERLGSQVFITGIDSGEISDMQAMISTDSPMFHVEQGEFREV